MNLEIKQGEFFTLLGPSGCGKTTLLRMIAGFNSVDGGEICFDDKVINNLEAHKRDIGMVFQNYAIFPHLTVAENVAYGLKAKKYPEDEVPPPEVIGQNIWFIIGERGEVTEAKAEAVTTEGELCPALPEAFSNVSFGPFRIGVNLKPREIKKLEIPEPSVAEEDSPWRYWFATNKESHPIHYGLMAHRTIIFAKTSL